MDRLIRIFKSRNAISESAARTPPTGHRTAQRKVGASDEAINEIPVPRPLQSRKRAPPQTIPSIASIPLSLASDVAPALQGIAVVHGIAFDPTKPINTSGGFGDLFVGIHVKEGKVALKRMKHNTEDSTRVSLHPDWQK